MRCFSLETSNSPSGSFLCMLKTASSGHAVNGISAAGIWGLFFRCLKHLEGGDVNSAFCRGSPLRTSDEQRTRVCLEGIWVNLDV